MEPAKTVHIPVLLSEVLEGLAPRESGIYFDGTLGGGGHTIALAERIGLNGKVIGCDRDATALDRAEKRIRSHAQPLPIRLAQANYADFPEIFELLGIEKADGFLLDLGLSSDQLADRSRGFSFDSDGELDLRFDTTEGKPAWALLERLGAEQIADLIFQYGEERFSRRIAREIVRRREDHPIRQASELAEICRRTIPAGPRGKERIDPATRTFQALRIAVNGELDSLEKFLARVPNYLRTNGRVAIISFHSLEDRIVKNAFKNDSVWNILTKKPIEATEIQRAENPRSRSAKLRIAEKKS